MRKNGEVSSIETEDEQHYDLKSINYTSLHNFVLKTNPLNTVFSLTRARPALANKHPDILNIPSGEEALCLDEVPKERVVVPSRYCSAGLQVTP